MPPQTDKAEPLTDEQRLAFDNALKNSLSQTVEVGELGCVHQWDFATDTCTKCGVTYQWAIDRLTAPLVDREALAEAVRPFVDQFDGNATSRKYLCADALLASGILHPMQTRDEIAITLIETRLWKGAWLSAGETERDIFYQQADAILALIEGAKP